MFLLLTLYIAATIVQQQLLTRLVVESPATIGKVPFVLFALCPLLTHRWPSFFFAIRQTATIGVPCAFAALVVYAVTVQKPHLHGLSQGAIKFAKF